MGIRTNLLKPAFALAAVIGYGAAAEDVESVPATAVTGQAGLGFGWDTDAGRATSRCVVPDDVGPAYIYEGTEEASTALLRESSVETMQSQLGFQVESRARFGVASTQLAASFVSNNTESSLSSVVIYSAQYNLKNKILNGARVPQRLQAEVLPSNWVTTCGDKYVGQFKRGARLYIAIKFDFASEETKTSFEAKFKVKGPLASIQGKLDQAKQSFSDSVRISIEGYQLGGDVTKLSSIFSGLPGSSAQQVDNNLNALVTCDLGHPEPCQQLIKNALNYGTSTSDPNAFPQQLRDKFNVEGDVPSAATLEYVLEPYSHANFYPNATNVVTGTVETSRRQLSEKFEEEFGYSNRLKVIKSFLSGRLSQAELQRLDRLQQVVNSNMRILATAADECFDKKDGRDQLCAAATDRAVKQVQPVQPSELEFDFSPLSAGYYEQGGFYYQSFGDGSYCSYLSRRHFNWGVDPRDQRTVQSLQSIDTFRKVMRERSSPCAVTFAPNYYLVNNNSTYLSLPGGKYCSYNSPDHLKYAATASRKLVLDDERAGKMPLDASMEYTGLCPFAMPQGNFVQNNTIFYATGNGHYCGYNSTELFEVAGKLGADRSTSRLVDNRLDLRGSGNAYDGVCVLPKGNFMQNNTVFFSYGNGHYCGYNSISHLNAIGPYLGGVESGPALSNRVDLRGNGYIYEGLCHR